MMTTTKLMKSAGTAEGVGIVLVRSHLPRLLREEREGQGSILRPLLTPPRLRDLQSLHRLAALVLLSLKTSPSRQLLSVNMAPTSLLAVTSFPRWRKSFNKRLPRLAKRLQ
jgi:hypothetical protein